VNNLPAFTGTITVQPRDRFSLVPEPASWVSAAVGLLALGSYRLAAAHRGGRLDPVIPSPLT
jgi:hypothetical protein